MLREKTPKHLTFESVFVLDSSGKKHPGLAAIKKWTSKEAFNRGFKKSAKIVGTLIAITLPFAFMEPFAFMVWGSIALGITLLFVGPFLHMTYWNEPVSFFYVETSCPYCKQKVKLTSYVSTAFADEFTALCPNCGQTSRVITASRS